MKEEIGQILEQLKLKNLSVSKVEKALEFSNGTLGKARDGKINLPTEKMGKLRVYAKVHLEKPALDGVLKPLEIDPLSDLIDVRKEQDAFCIERGWNVPDLIEKIKGFEIRIKYYAESKIELEQELGRITENNIGLLAKNSELHTKLTAVLSKFEKEYGLEPHWQLNVNTKALTMKEKLRVKIHSFYFSDGTWVKWTPVVEDGKAHGLFNVTIEFPPTEHGSDIVRQQHHGPPSAHSSLHWLKWAIKDRVSK